MKQELMPRQDEFLSSALAVESIVGQQKLIKDIMSKVMVKDQHYGKIPGCDKPSLWKPGAEVICMTFRLSPEFTSETIMDGKHMTVRTICRLTHIPTGKIFGSGEALCSTREKKYRLRKDGGKVVENGNLEDCWNTVLKMANKRALVAAVLVVTAASDLFTQDMGEETYVENDDDNAPAAGPVGEAKPKQEAEKTGSLRWVGEFTSSQELEGPNKKKAWQLTGEGGVIFKTDRADLVKNGVEANLKYDVIYHINGKGTQVIDDLKEVS